MFNINSSWGCCFCFDSQDVAESSQTGTKFERPFPHHVSQVSVDNKNRCLLPLDKTILLVQNRRVNIYNVQELLFLSYSYQCVNDSKFL